MKWTDSRDIAIALADAHPGRRPGESALHRSLQLGAGTARLRRRPEAQRREDPRSDPAGLDRRVLRVAGRRRRLGSGEEVQHRVEAAAIDRVHRLRAYARLRTIRDRDVGSARASAGRWHHRRSRPRGRHRRDPSDRRGLRRTPSPCVRVDDFSLQSARSLPSTISSTLEIVRSSRAARAACRRKT